MEEFKVYQTNAALGYRQLAYLLRLTGDNYLCIDVNCNTDIYKIGYVVEDLADFYVQDSDYKINDSPIFGSYLFDCLKQLHNINLHAADQHATIHEQQSTISDLEARLKEAVDLLKKEHYNTITGVEYYNEVNSFLTKEKTNNL